MSCYEDATLSLSAKLWLIGAIATALALSPLFVRPNQPDSNPQPFVIFLLPEPTIASPIAPVLIAVTLPNQLATDYSLSELIAFANDFPIFLSPLFDQPFFDQPSQSFCWLFFGFLDLEQLFPTDEPLPSLTVSLSAFAFFTPSDPSLPPLSASDQLTLSFSLTQQQSEESEEKQTQPAEKGEKATEPSLSAKSSDASQSSLFTRLTPEAFRKLAQRDPEKARKLFEQEIATRALSEAKKNPKSVAKGNGIILTVGAYPTTLPADGMSTAFIVARVTDEKGKPLAGKIVRFVANAGKVLVPQAITDEQGLALSRFCSEELPKGKKKIATIKAQTNPTAETSILMDGSLTGLETLSTNVSASLSVWWWSHPPNTQSLVCSGDGGSASGFAGFAVHVVVPSSPMHFVFPNYLKVDGDGHPFQKAGGEPYSDQYAPCAPSVGTGYVKYSWAVYPEMAGWPRFHRSDVTLRFNYTVARPFPPPGQFWTQEKTATVQAVNAVLKLSPQNPPVLAWDPENPPPEDKRKITFEVQTLQTAQVAVTIRIYRTSRYNGEGPVKTVTLTVPTNQEKSYVWDGSVDDSGMPNGSMDGSEMPETPLAEKGLYAYDVQALVQQVVPNRFDADWSHSPYMKIERAVDEEGKQIFEAEYYGYDDNGTEGVEDDGYFYFIRWYVLKCGSTYFDDDGDAASAMMEDNDGDKRLDEDWVDGIDNDGDGRVDEDPSGGWDEDRRDGQDNDQDGQIDEDGPNPDPVKGEVLYATKGEVLLYDPDLECVARWDLGELLCLEHGTNDGLRASLEGMKHGVLVRVRASLMQKVGTYTFVLRVWDNHAHLHKDHQPKPALEMNQTTTRPFPIVWIRGGYGNTSWFGVWCREPSLVRRLTHWASEFDKKSRGIFIPDWVRNNTAPGEVKGACNGGFFNPNNLALVGHVGLGGTDQGFRWEGNDISTSRRLNRYAFGMPREGQNFNFEVRAMEVTQQGQSFIHRLPDHIRNNYPYGLSGIGLLVEGGRGRDMPNESPFTGSNSRTAIAWSRDRQHFFLIVAARYMRNPRARRVEERYVDRRGWTWNQTRQFFLEELPRWMQNDLPNWMRDFRRQLINERVLGPKEAAALFPDSPVRIEIDYALMLDGGGSSQIAWLWKRRNRPDIRRHREYHQEFRPVIRGGRIVDWVPRRVPTFVEVNANVN